MGGPPARALFLFVDGVGIGVDDPERNPFSSVELPTLRALLGGWRLVAGELERAAGAGAAVAAADATLGYEGLPQSGTGQTSLLTGFNAARAYGRHFGPWVPTPLRERLGHESVLARVRDAGRRPAFANATPAFQLGLSASAWRRPAAPPLAAVAAGAEMRGGADLRAGRAVASSITNERWRLHVEWDVPEIEPAQAGRALARISAEADLTLFAHYDTDFAGHGGDAATAERVLLRLDAFLGGILDALAPDTLLLLSSDHGNLEDLSTEHTRNPVPVLAAGPGAAELVRRVRGITDVAPALLRALEIPSADA